MKISKPRCASLVVVLVTCCAAPAAMPQSESYLYRALFVRAAPGKLIELIDLYKQRMPVYEAGGDERPFWMRHSQGDHWDLLFLFPMGSYTEFYAPERVAKRTKAADASKLPHAEFARSFYRMAAWHEELFVQGPPLEVTRRAFEGAGFYHIEVFLSLPGKQEELRRQREMENVYLKELGRPQNLVFHHDQGAAWDLFTIGFYRDLPHYAESAGIPPARQDAAAKAAGFESSDQIGPYLRSLIAQHHDTLAVAIR